MSKKKGKKKKVHEIELDLDTEVIATLEKVAAVRGITLNELMIEIIRDTLDRHE